MTKGGPKQLPRHGRHGQYFDFVEALRGPECAICAIAAQTRWRYLEAISFECVNDLGIRAKLRQSLGFCNRHAWYLVDEVRDVFGAAIIYRDVLHTLQAATVDLTRVPAGAFDPRARCIACLAEDESTDLALAALGRSLHQPEVAAAFNASPGLCGPHLLRATALARPPARRTLVEVGFAAWERNSSHPAALRWRAVGRAGTFDLDLVALGSKPVDNPSKGGARNGQLGAGPKDRSVSATPDPTLQFHCTICEQVTAHLAELATQPNLDDGRSGVCNRHAWLPPAERLAPISQRLLAAERTQIQTTLAASSWRDAVPLPDRWRPVPPAQAPPLRCLFCAEQGRLEAQLAATATGTLCVPHLRLGLTTRGLAATAPTRAAWAQLDQLLGEHIRKEDYRFRSEPRGDEQYAPRWAVGLVAGARGVR
jgi:hypothetical protein